MEMWVQLENSGPGLQAEIRIRVTGSWGATAFAVPVSLPTGSRKRIPIYVLPNNFSHALEVQLVAGNDVRRGAKLAGQDVRRGVQCGGAPRRNSLPRKPS